MSKNCNINVNAVFISIRNPNEIITLQIKSENTTDINEIFDQLIKKHETHSESLKDINFKPEGIESTIYNFTETIISNTFIESPEWIKNKKCTINSQNKEKKCFQYFVTISLHHQKVKYNPERISKIKPFINNLDFGNINFPPQEQDYKTFEMNNKSTALNILHTHSGARKISYIYKSEFNKTREKQVILLMITDGQTQHYLAVKKLNALLKMNQIIQEIIV